MKDQLQTYAERHKHYDNIDGTGEMFFGLMFLGFALLGYLQGSLPKNSLWTRNGFAGLLFMYAILIPALGLGYLIRWLIKKYITWPRTGYVAVHSVWCLMFAPKPSKVEAASAAPPEIGLRPLLLAYALVAIVSAVVAGVGAVVVAYCVVRGRAHHGLVSLARISYTTFFVLIYAFWIFRMGKGQRWKWLVLVLLATGLLAIDFAVPGNFAALSRPVTLFVGLVWLLSGLSTLYSYLRHTPLPSPEAE